MAIAVSNQLKSAEWSKHKSILSGYTGIGNQLKKLETEAKKADEDDPDDLRSVLDILSDLLVLTFKAKDKKNKWAEKTADWLDEVNEAAKSLQSKLYKMVPAAEEKQRAKAAATKDAVMKLERDKKLKVLIGKLPGGISEGADLKLAVSIMGLADLDIGKFNNVNTIAQSFDIIKRDVNKAVKLMEKGEESDKAEEKEAILEEFRKIKKRVEPLMDGANKAAKTWETEISKWSTQARKEKEKELLDLILMFGRLRNEFDIQTGYEVSILNATEKLEAKVEKEMNNIYKITEE